MAAKGVELASAYISLSVETSSVATDVRKALEGSTKHADSAGKDIGRRMSDAITDEVGRAGRESGAEFGSGFRRETSDVGRKAAAAISGDLVQQADRSGRKAGSEFASSFSRAADNVKVDVQGVGRDAGSDAGSSFLSGFSGGIASLGMRGGPIATAIAAGGLAGIKLLAPQISAAMQQELSRDIVQGRLGLSDAVMKDVAHAAGDAFAGNFGASVEDNLAAAQQAFKRGLLDPRATEDQIQSTIEQLQTLATVMESDVGTAANSVGQLVRTGMAPGAKAAFDLLTVGAQNIQTDITELADSFSQNAATLKQFGIDGQTAMSIFKQSIDAGAPSAETFVGLLQELAGNAGNEAEAFESLGLNAEEMARKLTGGGTGAKQALDQLLDSMRNTDPITRSNSAIALFGEEATAMQEAILAVDLGKIVTEFQNVEGASQRAANTFSSNAQNEWTTAANHIKKKLAEIRDSLNMSEWFSSIPAAVNDWFEPDPTLTPGAPGVPPSPNIAPGPALAPSGPGYGGNPLDIFAPTGRPQGIRGRNAAMGVGMVPIDGAVGGRVGGAAQRAIDTAIQEARGQAYEYGGTGANGRYDCSGIVSKIYSAATGRSLRFTTNPDQLMAAGFRPGFMPGALNVGMKPGEGVNGHMAATLPNGVNVESGGAHGTTAYGGPAAGAMSFPQQWYFPLSGYATGGAAMGPGGPMADKIPAWLSNGEHVLTARDVAAMGGQGGVYAFRNALHRSTGGAVPAGFLFPDQQRGKYQSPGSRGKDQPHNKPSDPEFGSIFGPGIRTNLGWWGTRGPWGNVVTQIPWWMEGGHGRAPITHRNRLGVQGFAEGGAVDPAMLMQLIQQGQAAVEAKQGQPNQPEQPAADRTEGYIPAGAGYSGKTGGGLAGGLLQMGAEAINGLIDQAASMGAGAANMFAPGSGAAVQMGAGIAKRAVSWGAEMAGIGIGAITEILSPFGAPRWLADVDPTSFMPQWTPQQTATTTGEKTGLAAKGETYSREVHGKPKGPGGPGQPVQPGQFPGASGVISGAQAFQSHGPAAPFDPMKSTAKPGQPAIGANMGANITSTPPAAAPTDPMNFLKLFGFSGGGAVYDGGGILEPNSIGINLSNRPEAVFNQSTLKNMEAVAAQTVKGGDGATYNVYAANVDEAIRELRKNERRNARTHMVRP